MKRRKVMKRLEKAAKAQGLDYEVSELTNHTGVRVGDHRSTIGRHSEIDETTVVKFYKQFEDVLGKGWWR